MCSFQIFVKGSSKKIGRKKNILRYSLSHSFDKCNFFFSFFFSKFFHLVKNSNHRIQFLKNIIYILKDLPIRF